MRIGECVRGCRIPAVVGEGTAPAVTFDGAALCQRCLARLGWALDDAADVGARARLAVVPGMGGGYSERVSGSRDNGLPFNVAALESCDEVVNALGRWVTYWAQEAKIAPPRALLGAVAADRDVEGVRAGTDPDAVAAGLTEWAFWVKRNMPLFHGLPAMGDFYSEMVLVVERVGRRFPRDSERRVGQERPRYCPICEMCRVWVSWSGLDPVVACGSCGWQFDAEWGDVFEAIGIPGGRG